MLTIAPRQLSVHVLGTLRIKRLSPSLLAEAEIEDRSDDGRLCLDLYQSTEALVVTGSRWCGLIPKTP